MWGCLPLQGVIDKNSEKRDALLLTLASLPEAKMSKHSYDIIAWKGDIVSCDRFWYPAPKHIKVDLIDFDGILLRADLKAIFTIKPAKKQFELVVAENDFQILYAASILDAPGTKLCIDKVVKHQRKGNKTWKYVWNVGGQPLIPSLKLKRCLKITRLGMMKNLVVECGAIEWMLHN